MYRDTKDPSVRERDGSEVNRSRKSGGGDERRDRIATAAYHNAERRGFQEGGEVEDWLEAERQIDGSASEKGPEGEASAHQSGASGEAGASSAPASTAGRPDFPDLDQAGIAHVGPDEVKKWARQLNVPAPKLRAAIKRVGPVLNDIKRFLDTGESHP